MKILILDTVSSGTSHLIFNTTIIKSFIVSNLSENIDVLIDEEQRCLINEKSAIKKVNFIKGVSNARNNKSKYSYFVSKIKNQIKTVKTVRKNKPHVIFVLASDNLLTPFSLFLCKKTYKIDVFVILHNNIDGSKNSRLKRYIWKLVFKNKIKGIVLSEFIQEYANKLFKYNPYLLSHPTYKDIETSNQVLYNNNNNKKSDFLLLGRHSFFFYEDSFNERFFEEVVASKEKINLSLGKIGLKSNIPNLKIIEYSNPLSHKEYWSLLSTTKFLIIPPQAGRRLSASGVHLDAITMGIPTIAPRQGTFIENTPELGKKLLYNEKTINEYFKKAIEMDESEYLILSQEVLMLSETLSLPATANRIEEIFNDI